MQIQVVNKGIDVSPALRERVEERVTDAVAKYFGRDGEAFVVITRDGPNFAAECSLHLPSGVLLAASGSAGDAYDAVGAAMTRLEKRLRRYKRRLTDRRGAHKNGASTPLVVLRGPPPGDVGLDADDGVADEADEDALYDAAAAHEPLIVAETVTDLPVMTVGMAVLEMGLTDAPALIFKNAAHGGINVVYRRPDGHFGWLDPERARASEAS